MEFADGAIRNVYFCILMPNFQIIIIWNLTNHDNLTNGNPKYFKYKEFLVDRPFKFEYLCLFAIVDDKIWEKGATSSASRFFKDISFLEFRTLLILHILSQLPFQASHMVKS